LLVEFPITSAVNLQPLQAVGWHDGKWDDGMPKQDTPALILKLKGAGKTNWDIRAAVRMKLDGRGSLLYWDAETGRVVSILVETLEAFIIQPVFPAVA
jgi:hypothetical protein